MSGQLSWTREGETLALHGELDQDLLVPLWEARAQATAGTAIIDLSQTTRAVSYTHLDVYKRQDFATVDMQIRVRNLRHFLYF